MQDLDRQFPEGIPRLDPVEDMQIEDAGMEAAVRAIEKLEGRLAANEVFKVGCLGSCLSHACYTTSTFPTPAFFTASAELLLLEDLSLKLCCRFSAPKGASLHTPPLDLAASYILLVLPSVRSLSCTVCSRVGAARWFAGRHAAASSVIS